MYSFALWVRNGSKNTWKHFIYIYPSVRRNRNEQKVVYWTGLERTHSGGHPLWSYDVTLFHMGVLPSRSTTAWRWGNYSMMKLSGLSSPTLRLFADSGHLIRTNTDVIHEGLWLLITQEILRISQKFVTRKIIKLSISFINMINKIILINQINISIILSN